MGELFISTTAPASPRKPSLSPQQVIEDEEPVPAFFLDESAGIETSPPTSPEDMGNGMSIPTFTSSLRGTMSSGGERKPLKPAIKKKKDICSEAGARLKKFVRFLDRVEVVPAAPFLMFDEPSNKKQKTREAFNDPAITAGLGRAGSPNRSPNRSPNMSPNSSSKHLPSTNTDNHLSPPEEFYFSHPPSPPPSWRIPPSSLTGPQPHVVTPPRVRSPSRPGEEIDLMARDNPRDSGIYMDSSEDEDEIRPVIARKMWHGEVRFEDQWGRRLIPVEREDAFRFDLWPVEEDVDNEVGDGSGWVGRFRGMSRE